MNINRDASTDKNIPNGKSELVGEIFNVWENLVSEIITYHSRSLKVERLKLPSFFIMNYLYRNGPQNLSTLATITGVSKPTITRIIDNLEEHNLVSRTRDEDDRRKSAVALTKTASDKMNRIYFSKEEIKSELASEMSSDQLAQFRESIKALSTIVKRVSERKLSILKEGE